MNEKHHATPLLKWAGGKSWFVREHGSKLQAYLSETQGRHFEPFLGGAAVALFLGAGDRMVLTDVLEPLAEFYETVRDNPGGLAWALSALAILGVDEENYYRVRDLRPGSPVERAARLFYLNRIGFNGIYRENAKGDFNVPYGGAVHRKSIIGRSSRDAIESLFPNREKIQRVAAALQGAIIGHTDFEDVIADATQGDLLYVDPPYHTTFSSYSKHDFDEVDQERLAGALYDASLRGCAIVAHNHDTELVRYLYSEWTEIQEIAEKRQVAADPEKRKKASCVLITKGIDL